MRLMAGSGDVAHTDTSIPNIPTHTKTEWATGDTITAVKLNNLEATPGIFWVNVTFDDTLDEFNTDKTLEETYNALMSGMLPVLKDDFNEGGFGGSAFAMLCMASIHEGSPVLRFRSTAELVWNSEGLNYV